MARHSRRPNWALRSILIGGVLLIGLYCFVVPLVQFGLMPSPQSDIEVARTVNIFADNVLHRLMDVAIAIWFLVLGTSVGSFLNVVVYRMPLGKSLVAKGSYCPHCRVPIHSVDNVPVLGWIKLRGRCRACRLPIAPRYPIVEAVVGAGFFLIFWCELVVGGANLPNAVGPWTWGILPILSDSRWDLFGIYLFQMTAFSILCTGALIVYDNHRIPVKLVIFGCVTSVLLPPCWPSIQHGLQAWFGNSPQPPGTLLPLTASGVFESYAPWLEALGTATFGLLFGACLGMSINRWVECFEHPDSHSRTTSLVFGLMMIGGFAGWQACVSCLTFACILFLFSLINVEQFAQRWRTNWLHFLSVAFLIQTATWRLLDPLAWWPGSSTSPTWASITQAIVVGGVAVTLQLLRSRMSRTSAKRFDDQLA